MSNISLNPPALDLPNPALAQWDPWMTPTDDDPASGIVNPVRVGRHIVARPMLPGDLAWLYGTVATTTVGSHWRVSGAIPTAPEFEQLLLAGASMNYLLATRESGEPVGFCQLLARDPHAGHAHLSAFIHPRHQARGWPLEGIVAYLDLVMVTLALHKVYLESAAPAAAQYGSAAEKILDLEGTMRGHQVLFGKRVDTYLYAAYPDRIRVLAERILPTSLLATIGVRP